MALKAKYQHKHETFLRDVRPWSTRMIEKAKAPSTALMFLSMMAVSFHVDVFIGLFADLIFFIGVLYIWFLISRPTVLPFKLPRTAGGKDKNNIRPGGATGPADGILYLGNEHDTKEEIWFTNTDARTHILFLGTTGSGKSVGLKSIAANALCWGSGFIYVDGKADTTLWSTVSAIARRFGRDDDMLIMNYMTGGLGGKGASNTLNPFSSGSASYLTNMMTSLMPDAEGDNAMWKERAVALISGLMPCLVWKRDNQNVPLSVGVIRRYIGYGEIIKLSRDKNLPETMRTGLKAYLNELPGFQDGAYDDNGQEKPQSPDAPPFDPSVPRQQHGYLSMQFTRSLQSLGDDYGYIFDTQAADVDMMDVVLQRRMLIVLIPALEKSSDETANLGKIISSTLKGMMGGTLGHTVEGEAATIIENKPTASSTPFIAIFDEVGYYAAQGMAVMAAQARSLGFCLVYAAQDLPAMEKRVKEEARSITANCNIKIFGKLEDPTQTKDFFEKTVGSAIVTELSGYQKAQGSMIVPGGYSDAQNASIQNRARANYDGLRAFTEGRAVCCFGKAVNEIQIYNAEIGDAKVMRVQRFLPIPPPAEDLLDQLREVNAILKRFRDPAWDPLKTGDLPPSADLAALADGFSMARKAERSYVEAGGLAVAALADRRGLIKAEDALKAPAAAAPAPAPAASPPVTAPTTPVTPPVPPFLTGGAVSELPAAVRRPPPVTEEKSKTADAAGSPALPSAGGEIKGPLSWMDVIGAGVAVGAAGTSPPEKAAAAPDAEPVMSWDKIVSDAAKEPASSAAKENQEKPAAADLADAAGPLSWSDVIGLASAPAAVKPAPTQIPLGEELSEDDVGISNAAGSSGGPLNWSDIVGSGSSSVTDEKNGGKSGTGE